ncbi:MAG: hypothetical protein II551_00320 [Paludibacteraceae bacterium]|nr:hypothetical protein [Paludibacteraceae bacterium]
MKTFWKIFKICAITLVCLIAVVILTAGVLVWIVFTPERVTPIVRKVADEYVTVPHELGEVDLTFFSTFPYFGVRVDGLEIVNPMPGVQNDTLLSAKEVVATIDIMAFLNTRKLDIGVLTLRDIRANVFINEEGKGNWEVFKLPPDTMPEDTSAFELPFDEIRVDNAMMASNRLSFVDKRDSIDASIQGFAFDATIDGWDDVRVKLKTLAVNARVKETTYATNAEISIDAPAAVHLDSMHFALRDASIEVNDLKLGLDGWITLQDDIRMDITANAKKWDIGELLALVPKQFVDMLSDIDAEGTLSLEAAAKGVYNDSVIPVLDAHLLLEDAKAQYKPLPFVAENIAAEITAHLDINDSLASTAEAVLEADTKKSHVRLQGKADELLSDALIDATATLDAYLPDFAYFLPKDMKLDGRTKGDIKLKARLSELTSMTLRSGTIHGDLNLQKLGVKMNDMQALVPSGRLSVRLPNNRPSSGTYRWLGADLQASNVDARMNDMKVQLKQPILRAETNNILQGKTLDVNMALNAAMLTAKSDSMDVTGKQPRLTGRMQYNTKSDALPVIDAKLNMAGLDAQYTDIKAALKKTNIAASMRSDSKNKDIMLLKADLQTPDLTASKGDSIQAHMTSPKLAATMQYNSQDTTTLPTIDATIDFADMDGSFNDITASLKKSKLTAGIRSEKNKKQEPQLNATLASSALKVTKGETVKAQTQTISVDAKAHYNPRYKNNVLLQWNPHLRVNLQQGEAELAMFSMPIIIPAIDFSYTNKIFKINRSEVQLGSSDFSLSGDINDIGPWLRGEGILKGDLLFVSDYTDVNELMAMFSADEGSEEHASETQPKTEKKAEEHTGPFLVPDDVDLELTTKIGTADVFTEQIHNVGGKVYVRNGILALEEMGFVCNAARLQLTAMYRTPRKSHLYLGLDYHMLDVDIDTLISMVPIVTDMVPMLSSFKGNAEFHLAAETYLNQNYEPKMSTLRGAASLFAKDLVVMDGETFSQIAKLLMFNKKTENKIDSISAELTVYKNEIDVYPFCVQMDNYMVALGGRHNTNMTFDYDINVLSPIYLGVNVSGDINNLKIKLAKCKFAKDFRPIFHRKVDTESADLRKRIRTSLQKSVKI